jgi:hypothetical protein
MMKHLYSAILSFILRIFIFVSVSAMPYCFICHCEGGEDGSFCILHPLSPKVLIYSHSAKGETGETSK